MDKAKEKEILIIGGGIAGLSAGIYARKNGYAATIVEQHDKPGGQLTAWNRNGYRFDFCLQWLCGTRHGVYHGIWNELGAIPPASTTSVVDDIVIDHEIFIKLVDESGEYGEFFVYADMDRWEAYLKNEVAPEDAQGIHKLCTMIKTCAKLDEFENPPGMRSLWDYLCQLYKSWSAIPIIVRYLKKSTKELLDDLGFQNEKLRYVLTELGQVGEENELPALALLMMLAFQHDKNSGYLKGGSAAMSQRVREEYEKLGGKFKFNAKVVEIVVEDHSVVRGVKLENGERVLADHCISACDGHTVLYDMLGGGTYDVPSELKKPYEEWSLFTPIVMVAFGIDKTIVSDAHNIGYFSPKNKIQIGRTMADGYNIMNRSMYDDTLAPKGKTVLEIEFMSPWEIWETLSDDEYAQEKEDIKKRCIELLEKHYSGVSANIEVFDLATPRTTARFTGVWKGAYEGFVPGVNNLGTYLPTELDGLANFSMAGQWVMPGGGLPPSAQSGRWAIQKLAKKDNKKFKH
eukprot:scaffold20416_cov51-Attheya_sp.AAC.5